MGAKCVVVAVLTASLPALADDDPWAPTQEVIEIPPRITYGTPLVLSAPSPPGPPASTVSVRGRLRHKSGGEMLIGGTITVVPVGGGDAQSAITGENGEYSVQVPPGHYTVTVYYLDVTKEIATNLAITNQLDLGDTMIENDSGRYVVTCCFGCFGGPEMSAQPYFGLTATRSKAPVSRDRTHLASIALVAGADARTVVTTLERGVRLHGAPSVPTIFVDETTVWTLRTPIMQATGSGGTADVTLRSGSNETRADARLVLGLDRASDRTDRLAAQEVFVGAPIKTDMAWVAVGLAADADRRANGLVRVNVAAAPEQQGDVIALAQDVGTARDGWAQGRWTSKFLDNKLQLRATVTGERLELAPTAVAHAAVPSGPIGADLVQRGGGAADVTYRFKALGSHTLELFASSGAGSIEQGARVEGHSDLALAVGDSWQMRPNIVLDVGVRGDKREVGVDETTIVSPRVSLTYDVTREGRSDAFIAVQRVPHLDDGLLGAWRGSSSRFHDEVATGFSYEPEAVSWLMFGIAGRAQRREGADQTEIGGDGWLRLEKRRNLFHVAGSTLRRTATLYAQHRLHEWTRHGLAVATTARTTQLDEASIAPGTRVTEGGGAFVWTWQPGDRGSSSKISTSIEGYGGTLGPGARLVLGGTW